MSRDGDSMVTTPVYAGSAEDVARAAHCIHKFMPYVLPVINARSVVQIEKCEYCVASRARLTPVSGATVQDILDGV